jgi:hypothetical protein
MWWKQEANERGHRSYKFLAFSTFSKFGNVTLAAKSSGIAALLSRFCCSSDVSASFDIQAILYSGWAEVFPAFVVLLGCFP